MTSVRVGRHSRDIGVRRAILTARGQVRARADDDADDPMTAVTSAPATLLRPDWAQPSDLAARAGRAPARRLRRPAPRRHRLRPARRPSSRRCSVETVAALCRDRPVPEIVLHDDPAELAAIGPLPVAAGADRAERRRGAGRPLDRARAVKADRRRGARARRPLPLRAGPGPGRRATRWSPCASRPGADTRRSSQRTLPSVLQGKLRAPRGRWSAPTAPIPPAAPPSRTVARRDQRVRFLELPERPAYPPPRPTCTGSAARPPPTR